MSESAENPPAIISNGTINIQLPTDSSKAVNGNNNRVTLFLSQKTDSIKESYGWFNFRPAILQPFASPKWVLFWLCCAGALQGLSVSGFVNVMITTIEKRYRLSSTQSGLIVGGYDMASLIFLIPVSYLGSSRSKPRFIATGVFLLAIGSFTFALPHLTAGPYVFTKDEETQMCSQSKSELKSPVACLNRESLTSSGLSNYLYVFIFAMILNGAASSPFYTLGCTYIEENVSTATSSLYLGIYYTMAILGPAIGYILGGQLLRLYVDFGVDVASLGLTPSSNIWVGAWWMGFIFSGVMCLIVLIPISGLPYQLPGANEVNAKKLVETHKKIETTEAVRPEFGISVKDLPVSLKILLTNWPFMLLSIAASSESLIVGGLATFGPKIAEQQFRLSSSLSALLIGIVAICAAGGGTFFGSYLVKRFDMKYNSILKMCVGLTIMSFCFISAFVLYCPNGQFAGLNVSYDMNDNETLNSVNFTSKCNSQCMCSHSQYDPICGMNGVEYYSPCHAGCKQLNSTGEITKYFDCECIQITGVSYGERRRCASDCYLLIPFLILQFLLMFCTFVASIPSLSATLRCVAKSQKSFGLGIQWVMIRLLGAIPAPIVFGYFIDLSCTLWQSSCHESGACLFYDNKLMARYLFILVISAKIVTCASVIGSYLLYKSPINSNSIDPCDEINTNISTLGIVNRKNGEIKQRSDILNVEGTYKQITNL